MGAETRTAKGYFVAEESTEDLEGVHKTAMETRVAAAREATREAAREAATAREAAATGRSGTVQAVVFISGCSQKRTSRGELRGERWTGNGRPT